MEKFDVYKDIAERTGGDIYIGVVGAVRTGKSTFTAKVTEKLILPNIPSKLAKKIATDEMPQSAEGKTVMTTQPKFIPSSAVKVNLGDKRSLNMRLIDCVGYLVEGVSGHTEDGAPRMVKTPWDDNEIPFERAAEIGTERVIKEHSTVCVLVTTDGSFTGIVRDAYEKQEGRKVAQLKEGGKPFCILLNVKNPSDNKSVALRDKLSAKYGVAVICKNCLEITEGDIAEIFNSILLEFSIQRIDVNVPNWIRALPKDSPLVTDILNGLKKSAEKVDKMSDFATISNTQTENMQGVAVLEVKTGEGAILCSMQAKEGVFYNALSQECGQEITDDYQLMCYAKALANCKTQYDKIKDALELTAQRGYGAVVPPIEDITLDKPEIVKEGGNYGVKIKANATSTYLMNVGVSASVTPFVGTKEQCEEMVNYLGDKYDTQPEEVLKTNMFGKSISQVVYDGVKNKLTNLSSETSDKLVKTVTKIVNEGKGGVICILL